MMRASLSRAVKARRLTYLTLFTPVWPGTTGRNGPPWASGIGTPFISQASMASAMALAGTERSTMTLLGSMPSGNFSPAVPVELGPAGVPPAERIDHPTHGHTAPEHAARCPHLPRRATGFVRKVAAAIA